MAKEEFEEKDLKNEERREERIGAPCPNYKYKDECMRFGARRCEWAGDYYKGNCFTAYKWVQTEQCNYVQKINYGDDYCAVEKPVGDYKCCGKYTE